MSRRTVASLHPVAGAVVAGAAAGQEVVAAWRAAKLTSALIARYPVVSVDIEKAAAAKSKNSADLRYLPLVSRQVSWVVLLAGRDARPVGHLPVDGFI